MRAWFKAASAVRKEFPLRGLQFLPSATYMVGMSTCTSRRTLIIGCGYVGLATGALLAAAGDAVFGLRRSADGSDALRAAGITPLLGDLTRRDDLHRLPGPFDRVVNCASSSRGGAVEYREVYLEGTRTLLDWLRIHPPAKYVHTSSTSVYAQDDGSVVDEGSPAAPRGETGRLLRDTEDLLVAAARDHGFPAVVLRVAGIYGPGRGHLFQQLVRGEARISEGGTRHMNMVHRDDVASAIAAVLDHGEAGGIYNCVDDTPVTQLGFLGWASGELGRPLPPHATGEEVAARKRGLTDKRVSNAKLRALGWSPRFPAFREGYAEAVAAARPT